MFFKCSTCLPLIKLEMSSKVGLPNLAFLNIKLLYLNFANQAMVPKYLKFKLSLNFSLFDYSD